MRILCVGLLVGAGLFARSASAQSPTIPLNPDYYHLIDRLEIEGDRWADRFHSAIKPYNRQAVVQLTDSLLNDPWTHLSPVDRYTIQYFRDDSWEWVSRSPVNTSSLLGMRLAEQRTTQKQPGDSHRPLGLFYRKKSDFFSYQDENFSLHINPAIDLGIGQEINSGLIDNSPNGGSANTRLNPFINTRGLEVRGSIRKKLGFYTYMSDNQATFPRYIQEYGATYSTDRGISFAPAEGLAKWIKQDSLGQHYQGADFLSARGYIIFNALKVIDLQFGHDRNFIGNGYRSLFLSDNSAPYLFLKITTRLGRFQYTNLLAEFQNRQRANGANTLNPRKYTAMHHLSVNLSNHLNIGLFEAEVFSRDQLELNYLNPIIFYRFVESYRGSADNALVGLDFKATFLRQFMVYGQFILDELLVSALRAKNGSWTNKFAAQMGFKYINAFGVPNLDLQGELNLARPYTYAHQSGQTNYVHYNQPLAHPLGANFIEGIGIVRFQPINRLLVIGQFGLMRYGVDPPTRNYGGNLLKNYNERLRDFGNYIGQGRTTVVTYGDVRLSYMLRHNFSVDLRQLFRTSDSQISRLVYETSNTTIALRWNLPYRNLIL